MRIVVVAMYVEIGILIVIILGVALFYNVHTPEPESISLPDEEGFESGREHNEGKVDIRVERQKLLDELSRVDVGVHEYPHSKDRSRVRVGLERMIAEIDRALETEGRYLYPKTVEAILQSGRQALV